MGAAPGAGPGQGITPAAGRPDRDAAGRCGHRPGRSGLPAALRAQPAAPRGPGRGGPPGRERPGGGAMTAARKGAGPGTVYLLHFVDPASGEPARYRHAAHYTGNPESSRFLKASPGFFAGGFAELAPLWAVAAFPELRQFLAHQREDRLVTGYGAVGGIDVPRCGLAAVGDVIEALVERAGSGIVLFHAQFGPVQASGTDPLLGGFDEEGADPARSQRRVDAELEQRADTWGGLVADSAGSYWQARWRADRQIVHLAALGAVQCRGDVGQVAGRPGPGARRQILVGQVADRQRHHDLGHEHLLPFGHSAVAGRANATGGSPGARHRDLLQLSAVADGGGVADPEQVGEPERVTSAGKGFIQQPIGA